ncbi:MAG: hypothetical protein Q8R47_06700 [Nanoarchaeota archaeon]|nr:hypothetical protein [Nanoarchaeota archaeon]
MRLAIFFLFLVLLPSIHALDCNSIANKQWCNDIQKSNISQIEKDYLLSDIISDSKHYPDHQLVKQWNSKVSTTTAPNGVVKKNSDYVKDSWVKILAVMPSVLFNDILYISNSGEIIVGYNHDVYIPSYTDSGDCKTVRSIVQNTSSAKLYINNQYVGGGHSVNYFTSLLHNADATIKAVYTAQVQVKIKHYTKQKEYYWKNGVKKYRWVCDYDYTEYKIDTVITQDILKAKIHNPQPTASFTVTDKYADTVTGDFISDNAVNVELTFFDSYYKEHNHVFSEVVSSFNTLTIKAEKQSSTEQKNLAYAGSTITVPKIDGCTIAVYDFFSKKVLPCNVNYENPEFTVTTDKTVYSENETIALKIEPAGKEYSVTYAGKEYKTKGELQITAVYPYDKIEVQYKDRIIPKLIHIKNEKPLNLAFALVIFGLGNYTLVGFIRKYWGVVLG